MGEPVVEVYEFSQFTMPGEVTRVNEKVTLRDNEGTVQAMGIADEDHPEYHADSIARFEIFRA